MATARYAPFLAVALVLQSGSTAANFGFPFLTPFSGNACRENVCGKGNCVNSSNSAFGFECECEDGWRQARSDDDHYLKFLPCVIPNCTFSYSCENDPAAAPANRKRANLSFLDPCFWTDCGGGSCNTTSPFTHTCECDEGYYNLFNSSAFPCYKECAIGLDCARLGLNITNSSRSTQPPPSLSDESESHAESLKPGVELGWLIAMVTTWAVVVWKHG